MAAFDLAVDADGVLIVSRSERVSASCDAERDVSEAIASLKLELDALEIRMKRLVRERHLVDPFAIDVD